MIRLINNEFIKIKKVKVIFTYICYIITLIILNKYSDKNILDLSYYLIPVIGVIVSILYGGIISSEKENGSFRYYLTKINSKYTIYISCNIDTLKRDLDLLSNYEMVELDLVNMFKKTYHCETVCIFERK